MLALSIGVGMWRAWPNKQIKLNIQNSDSTFTIKFGDIFQESGCICVNVNEFFDGIIGDHVSINSVHGQFIHNILGGQVTAFNDLVSKALVGESFEVVPRKSGNSKKYCIGTTAAIDVNGKRYLLFAHARTDINTLKAYASVPELWDSLAGLWQAIRIYSNGSVVSIPLVGSGLSGVGLPAINLIEIIIISYSYYTKKNKITGNVTLVLPVRLAEDINLLLMTDFWKKM